MNKSKWGKFIIQEKKEKKLHVKKSTSLDGLWVIIANEIGFAFGNMWYFVHILNNNFLNP
jgi:hypothetical protein